MIRTMSTRDKLLSEIEAYLARTGMAPTTFGSAVMNDKAFVLRLRKGKGVHADTVDHVRAWMADHPLARRRPRKAEARSAA